MRKTLTVAITGALLLGAFVAPSAEAKKKKPKRVERTAEAPYDSPAVGVGGLTGVCSGSNGCAEFAVASNEKFLDIALEDQTGTPGFFRVRQDTNGDGEFTADDAAYQVCGATEEPIAIEPGLGIQVFIYAQGVPPCPGVSTSGVVKATFSNLP